MPEVQIRRAEYRRPFAELAFSPWLLLPLALILGGFLAFQFFQLTPRYVKLLFAVAVMIGMVRLSFAASMTLFLVLWIAPTSIFLGDTNVIFIGVMTVLWLIRVRLGVEPRPVRTPIDRMAWIYLGLHFLSLINIESEFVWRGAQESLKFTVAGVIFYFLLVNALRSERHLKMALTAMCVTAVIVDVTALADHYLGRRLIPEWFIFAPAALKRVEAGGRAQGVFGFHGLLADFSAMSFYLQVMLGLRTGRRAAKLFYYGLALLGLHVISITANRGGVVIWVLGGLYFLWMQRHRIRWRLVALFTPVAAVLVAFAGVLSETVLFRIRVLSRLAQTQILRGMPENRVMVWTDLFQRIPEHLWIGHGPYIDLRRGIAREMYWPHNAYLFYLFTTGIAGLVSWLWIVGKTLWVSFPRGGVDFARSSLARATMAIFHLQVVMFAASQLRDEHQRGNVYYYYMWILFGLTAVAARLAREQAKRGASGEPRPGGGKGADPGKTLSRAVAGP